MRVNTTSVDYKPWSVPRLRGRGQQGNIVVRTHLCQCSIGDACLFIPKSAARQGSCPALSPADHGLASEARSTA
jgi:hypothetical protein